MNKPTKHFRLVCWRLLYKLAVEKTLDRQAEVDACQHARFPIDKWNSEKVRCHREWAKLLAKRQRRLNWLREHGFIDDGWTPPDPADPRRTANKPLAAFLARRHFTVGQVWAKHSLVPIIPKKGGHGPNWALVHRIRKWGLP